LDALRCGAPHWRRSRAGVSSTALNGGNLFNTGGLVWSIAAFKASAADHQQTVLLAFGQIADIMQALTNDARLLATQQRALDMASESVRLQRHGRRLVGC
jgi:outer membrane protein TolC